MSGCEARGRRLRVAVLLSGGVDSSLALRLLHAAGHDCVAFYLKIWFEEDFRNFWDQCPWEEDLRYARDVCGALDVPLEIVPLTKAYWDRVVSVSVAEIRAGRTPNPDMMCNTRVKFGAFYEYLDNRQDGGAFDRIASGHYACLLRRPSAGAQLPLHQSPTGHVESPAAAAAESHLSSIPFIADTSASTSLASQTGIDSRSSDLNTSRIQDGSHSSAGSYTASSSHSDGSSSSRGGSDALASSSGIQALTPTAGTDSGTTSGIDTRESSAGSSSSNSSSSGRTASPSRSAIDTHLWSQLVDITGSTPGGTSDRTAGETVVLATTPDAIKDQTYFLANLSQAQLQRVMFPLGPLTKSQVRQLATAADLANKDRRDSQGICFLGKVKFPEFVKEHLGEWPGLLVEEESSAVLGPHSGFWFFTVGQRGGIKLPGGPWYVVRKDVTLNIVYVSKSYRSEDKRRDKMRAGPFSWTLGRPPPLEWLTTPGLQCKVRHGPHIYGCTMQLEEDTATGEGAAFGTIQLDGTDQGLAAGQYAVLYRSGICLGSAKILECL